MQRKSIRVEFNTLHLAVGLAEGGFNANEFRKNMMSPFSVVTNMMSASLAAGSARGARS